LWWNLKPRVSSSNVNIWPNEVGNGEGRVGEIEKYSNLKRHYENQFEIDNRWRKISS